VWNGCVDEEMSCDQCDGGQEKEGPDTYEAIVTPLWGHVAGARGNVCSWTVPSWVQVAGHLNMAPMR